MNVPIIIAQTNASPGVSTKILGPPDSQATTQIPPAENVCIAEIVVCNRGEATTFRISITLDGGATGLADYLYFDTPIPANDSLGIEIGVTLSGLNVLRGESPGAITFTVIGTRT